MQRYFFFNKDFLLWEIFVLRYTLLHGLGLMCRVSVKLLTAVQRLTLCQFHSTCGSSNILSFMIQTICLHFPFKLFNSFTKLRTIPLALVIHTIVKDSNDLLPAIHFIISLYDAISKCKALAHVDVVDQQYCIILSGGSRMIWCYKEPLCTSMNDRFQIWRQHVSP